MKPLFTVRSISTVLLASPLSFVYAAPAATTPQATTPQATVPTAQPTLVKPVAVKPVATKPIPARANSVSPSVKPTASPTPIAKPTQAKSVAVPTPKPKPVAHVAVKAASIAPSVFELSRTQKLANGLTLVTRTDRTAPRVAYSLVVRASAADESAANAGWRRILTEAMLRSTLSEGFSPSGQPAAMPGSEVLPKELTGLQMQRLAEASGGQIGASVSDDTIEFWAVGESRGASALLNVMLQLATHPRLSAADIEAGRRRVAAAGEASQDDVAQNATAALRAQIYRNAAGAPLAYGLVPQGTETSRRAVSDDSLRAYYRSYFRPDNVVFAAAGSVEETLLATQLKNVKAPVRAEGEANSDEVVTRGAVPYFAPITKTEPALLVRQLPTADAWVFVSFLGAPSSGNDLPALAVMSAVLGEAPGARLPRRLLGTRPPSLGGPPDEIAQQAAVSFVPRRFGSEFVLYAQTQAGAVDSVKNALLDETRKLRDTNVSEAELMRAKNYVRGSWAVDREPLRERAYNAALAAATGGAPDIAWPANVQKVSAADIRRVAQKYLSGYAVALIMPQE